MDGSNRPLIVKRKRPKRDEPQHSGAWKVAYADFVTAMMAFFLIMWLLNATTEKQRKGLSDYFNPTVQVSRISGGGSDTLSGDTVFGTNEQARSGTGGVSEIDAMGTAEQDLRDTEAEALEMQKAFEKELFDRGGESSTMEYLLRHVVTRVTDEGLVIELFDINHEPLFKDQGSELTLEADVLMKVLAQTMEQTHNRVAVSGHVRAYPVVLAHHPAWPMSSARALAVRDALERHGLLPDRMQRVTGHADRKPVTRDPSLARNSRIEVILLR